MNVNANTFQSAAGNEVSLYLACVQNGPGFHVCKLDYRTISNTTSNHLKSLVISEASMNGTTAICIYV